ncbi:MAG: flavin reductase [Flavobacteriales bacterium]|nr:flavin reductase [Flavobacteriales bacterium]|tara:strand:+ start:10930 stop:11556 length:627 start_codon:yes stop_codon:yes gene_type:complete
MIKINPKNTETKLVQEYLLSAVGPRPIALASTIDKNNIPNLSPFSFFNVFSGNPPILIFSPARRIRNNTEKDTLRNLQQIKEVVINIVNYEIVEKMVKSSFDYASEIDEFIESGFTHLNSEIVKPYRVKESPVQMECAVNKIISLGDNAGSGNLIICEIQLIHISEKILNQNKKIDQNKIDLVGRMGYDWYIKSDSKSLFKINKNNIK